MIKQDYKPKENSPIRYKAANFKLPHWLKHPYIIIGTAIAVITLAIALSTSKSGSSDSQMETQKSLEIEELTLIAEETAQNTADLSAQQVANYSDPIAIPIDLGKPKVDEIATFPMLEQSTLWQTEAVKKGDNLSLIFKRIGLSARQVHEVINLDQNAKLLLKLKPGELISYQLAEGQLKALKYRIDIQQTLYIERTKNGLTSRIDNKSIEVRTAYAHGTIEDSLFNAGKKAGLTDSQVMQLANIFDWDIDFILDIRKGDSFSFLYEEKFIEGEKIGDGDILAAEFVNQGKSFVAVRYTDSKNNSSFYTPEGLSMRKAFLRAPVKFNYISSSFKPRRFHPILKRWKAHRGIDYRAPTGTPIRAAGDGRVIASSYNKYNGKYVFIQHGQGIVTKYLHMSKRAVSNNKRVKQGQVIGYVGATGLAEAPHLHYEFVVNGVHRNPRTVKLPQAQPVEPSEKDRFIASTQPWLNQLTSRNAVIRDNQAVAP
ncbi:peptidoglycan DD-metalloendopeptidase family protein [Aliikangiella sp. IMCC44653]